MKNDDHCQYVRTYIVHHGSHPTGASIYGATFEDENFIVPHSKRGVVSMANSGLHTNASQFIIDLKPMPWMDKRFVAFGFVIEFGVF